MAQVGQWADHKELAARLLRIKIHVGNRSAGDVMKDEKVGHEAAEAIRDLGDRLDKAEVYLHKLQSGLKESMTDLSCNVVGAGQKSAYREAARLAEEEAEKYHVQSVSFTPLKLLAEKFRQLAEGVAP